MKLPEALIIQNHLLCNLSCMDCQGPNAEKKRMIIKPPEKLSSRITLEELMEISGYLKEKGLIGNDRITAIRFGGDWCEPTLDSELPQKVNLLLKQTENSGCKITVITNGINIPSGSYDETTMRKYFMDHLGFEDFPSMFALTVSVDDGHFKSYQLRRFLEDGIGSEDSQKEYMEKIANLTHHAQLHSNVHNVRFNAVKPVSAAADFDDNIRWKFGIPNEFHLSTLRRSIYTPRQEELTDAVSLVGKDEPPQLGERCYFLKKRHGEIIIYPNIVSSGYNRNPSLYREFIFPDN